MSEARTCSGERFGEVYTDQSPLTLSCTPSTSQSKSSVGICSSHHNVSSHYGFRYISSEDSNHLQEDRNEIHRLLAEAELRMCDFFVYLMFMEVVIDDKETVAELVSEFLDLEKFRINRRVNM